MRSVEPIAIGARNPRLRRLRRLVGRSRARSEEQAFVVDGPQLVADVLRCGLTVEEIFAAPRFLVESGLDALIEPGTDVYEVDAGVLTSVLDPVNPRPLAAVVSTPRWSPDDLAVDRPVLVAVELRDPGNLGTVVRSAEGAGLAGVAIAGPSVDRFSPKVVRASAGSVFRTPLVTWNDPREAMDDLAAAGHPVLAAVVDPVAPAYDEVDLTAAAILVGNEPRGLAPELVDRAGGAFTIPLAPTVESLNVAAAASVVCFEAARQRRRRTGSEAIEPLDTDLLAGRRRREDSGEPPGSRDEAG